MTKRAPLHPEEEKRQALLDSYEILDTQRDEKFDRLTRLASTLIGTPMASITFIDRDRQWLKSAVGIDTEETARADGFCAYTVLNDELMVVEDAAADKRFYDNPFVTGEPHVRFYAGAPLTSRDGLAVGSLCVIDSKPRVLAPEQRRLLKDLAAMAVDEMELHKSIKQLHKRQVELQRTQDGLRAANKRLEELASTDALTGIANRRTLDACMVRELRRAARKRSAVSLLLIDADHFKMFNDLYGHQAGDACLRMMGEVLRAALHRPGDLAARYGGEEFAVFLPDTGALGAMQVAEAIRAEIEARRIEHSGNEDGVVSVSIGVATLVPDIGGEPRELVQEADSALYRAKEQGRNRVCAAEQTAQAARGSVFATVTRH
ncbi:MAG: sensor domain-containing diguanylate cyclase [Alphaproteobacteria bacterium]|nr:sensor domain-containing diguanylate cyclase [Alphaproteobacteria bacterium]MBV9541745.1 sensor domain-containing diguanylate cyclase [Alphaproteobacteria bacterium]